LTFDYILLFNARPAMTEGARSSAISDHFQTQI